MNLNLVEQRIAKFHQREDAILYISCFDANAGIFETLLKEQDYIISVSNRIKNKLTVFI